jgi:anti-anti-sigma factor
MHIQAKTAQGRVPITILQLEGDLDSSSFQFFEERAKTVIAQGARDLLIDLTQVTFMGSAGMRALNSLVNQLHTKAELDLIHKGIRDGSAHAPHLKLVGVTPRVHEVLTMTGLDMFIAIYKDTESAIASF